MTEEARPITVEEFMESMKHWIRTSISRSVRPGSATFEVEDLMQDAREALLQVHRDYPEKFSAGQLNELQKIGRRAIFFHTGNRYYSAKSRKAGGGANLISLLPGDEHQGRNFERAAAVIYEANLRDPSPHCDIALDRLIIREAVELVADESPSACYALQISMDPCSGASFGRSGDTRPAASLPSAGAVKIFRRVKKEVQHVLLRDGYMGVSAANQTEQGGHTMEGKGPEGPTSPDAPAGAPIVAKPGEVRGAPKGAVETAKPKRPVKKAAAKNGAAAKRRQSAGETAKASSVFAKGQKVTYVGGGRASWLKAGTTLEVKGAVVSRGRTYVRCLSVSSKRKVSLSSALLKK